MSLNLGDAATRAARTLCFNEGFTALRAGLGDLAQTKVNEAISSHPESRLEATAYARALRDVWVALEAAALGVRQQQVPQPSFTVAERMWLERLAALDNPVPDAVNLMLDLPPPVPAPPRHTRNR